MRRISLAAMRCPIYLPTAHCAKSPHRRTSELQGKRVLLSFTLIIAQFWSSIAIPFSLISKRRVSPVTLHGKARQVAIRSLPFLNRQVYEDIYSIAPCARDLIFWCADWTRSDERSRYGGMPGSGTLKFDWLTNERFGPDRQYYCSPHKEHHQPSRVRIWQLYLGKCIRERGAHPVFGANIQLAQQRHVYMKGLAYPRLSIQVQHIFISRQVQSNAFLLHHNPLFRHRGASPVKSSSRLL